MINNKNINLKSELTYIDFANKNISSKLISVPNLPLITRELTHKSQIAIVISNVLKLPLKSIVVLMLNNLLFLPELLKKDFATGIKLLSEIEVLYSRKKLYLLQSQITDTSVALNNEKILTNYFYLSKKYNFIPGLSTYNLESLITFLSHIKDIPDNLTIYTPINNISKSKSLMNFLTQSNIEFIIIK